MRLNQLHKAHAKDFVLVEELSPDQEQKLGYVQMMLARQGKDPDPIIRRIRGYLDPEFAKKQGAKASLERWLNDAEVGDDKEGRAYGRKVRITVLESEMRNLISEGFFKNVGALVVQKLRNLIGGERQEHELVSTALDTYPGLAALSRYARRAEDYIYDDPKFWDLVDKMTDNKADMIKRIVHSTFERISESAETYRGVLTECVVTEARISRVLGSLGLDTDTIDGLMRQYDIEDEDYDLSRLKSAYQQAKDLPADVVAKGKEKVGDVVSKVKDAARDVSGGQEYQVREENADFAEEVIKVAFALMQLDEADADTPEEANEVLTQIATPEYEVEPEPEPEYEVEQPADIY